MTSRGSGLTWSSRKAPILISHRTQQRQPAGRRNLSAVAVEDPPSFDRRQLGHRIIPNQGAAHDFGRGSEQHRERSHNGNVDLCRGENLGVSQLEVSGTDMSLEERADLILAFARVLYVNGQSTDQTLGVAEQVGHSLGLRAKILPRWGELQLQADDGTARLISAMATINTIAQRSPAPTWLFTLAAAAGAVALAVIFGVQHLSAAALIFASAAGGAILRRSLARYSDNVFLQPFCAALLAGVIGALAVRYQLSSSLRLVAVCPCMVLVPGPHVLDGALDIIKGRIDLGAARLIYAGLVIVAISTGLLIGLALLGVALPVGQAGRAV